MRIRIFIITLSVLLMFQGCIFAQSKQVDLENGFKIEQLLEQLKDKDYEVRKKALNALNKQGEIHSLDDLTTKALIPLLQDSDWRIRARVVIVLHNVNNKKMVIDPLIAVLSDESVPVVVGAMQTLSGIADEKVISEISKLLDSDNLQIRITAEEILTKAAKKTGS
ncbi:MAG: HEAT repeat domain-containing protein [Candidatus Omnitrophica bacterium]|nr:HEAT repeat domain-containing protein [Candidatus Omnitrophota bacterium]